MLERAAYLRKLATLGDGLASETVKDYPLHRTLLTVRTRSGSMEAHEDLACLLFVLDGRATLMTGASVDDAKSVSPGDIRLPSATGGARQDLRTGDVIHIAAGTPRQMLLTGDKTVTYFAIEIREKPEKA